MKQRVDIKHVYPQTNTNCKERYIQKFIQHSHLVSMETAGYKAEGIYDHPTISLS